MTQSNYDIDDALNFLTLFNITLDRTYLSATTGLFCFRASFAHVIIIFLMRRDKKVHELPINAVSLLLIEKYIFYFLFFDMHGCTSCNS